MFAKLNQAPLAVRVMLALLLLVTAVSTVMLWELPGRPARDVAFFAALFCACDFAIWLYVADLTASTRQC